MIRSLKRWRLQAEDRVRYSPFIRGLLCRYRMLLDRDPGNADPQVLARSIAGLCATARLATQESTLLRIEDRLRQRIQQLAGRRFDWREFNPDVAQHRIQKAVILKPYISPQEKGIIFISFEGEWTRLIHNCDLNAIAQRYDLIISPTWSPPHCLGTAVFAHAWPGPLFSLISNQRDLEILPRLASNYVALPLYASSWVNPGFYHPLPRNQRDVDIVVLANFARYKRHLVLFRALRSLKPRPRVLLMGQEDQGRTTEMLRAEADAYGVRDAVTILTNVSNEEVARNLCRSRVSLILSRREGSCVAVAESFFADTPVGLLRDAEIGSAAFINENTGRFLGEPNLAAELALFLDQSDRYSPRAWAEEHISCFQSCTRLNEMVKQHMLTTGQQWTCDLAPFYWRPDPCLVEPKDRQRLKCAYEDVYQRFNMRIGPATLTDD